MKQLHSIRMRLADYISWLRDEEWEKRTHAKMIAQFPWLGVRQKALVETNELDEPFIGRIYEAILHNGNTAFLVEIFEPVARESEEPTVPGTHELGPIERGYTDIQLYSSIEDARAAIPEALQKAIAQKNSTFTFTDKYGRTQTWVGYLPLEQEENK